MRPLGARKPARTAIRRDPAPSRWAYRWHRLWLTPGFRLLCRTGLPLALAFGLGALWLAEPARRDALVGVATGLRDKFEARPEFEVKLLAVEGASPDLAQAVRAKLALDLPRSSFDIDLDAARARVEDLDAIRRADLRVRSAGVLEVVITERVPVAVWRQKAGLTLLDDTGHRVAGLAARADRSDLPLVAGEGADAAIDQALDLYAAAGPVIPRLRGLVRVGTRRWDMILTHPANGADIRVLLPEAEPVRALEGLLALDAAQDLLSRDIALLDLRNDHRPSVRLGAGALTILRGGAVISDISTGNE
jgi:cell division protein FtsQ